MSEDYEFYDHNISEKAKRKFSNTSIIGYLRCMHRGVIYSQIVSYCKLIIELVIKLKPKLRHTSK